MNMKWLLGAALMAGIAGGAIADDTTTRQQTHTQDASFKALDADKDGYIEPQEAKNNVQLNQHYQEVDTNHDGKVSEREFMAATQGGTPRPDMMDRVPGSGSESGTYR